MRIAAISDIHGNAAALEPIWRCLEDQGLTGAEQPVLNAGDTVAYGADTMRCIEFVRSPERHILSVGGNYDFNVSRFPDKQDTYKKKWGKLRPEKYAALKKASAELTGDSREWLAALPQQIEIEVEGARFSISHYVPGSDKEGLFATTPETRLLEIAAEVENRFDVVIVGHTHSPFSRRAGNVLFVNPGSIGRSWGAPTYSEITFLPDRPPSARIVKCPAAQP